MNNKVFWKYFGGLVFVAIVSLVAQSLFFVPRINNYLGTRLEKTLFEKAQLALEQLQEEPTKNFLQTPHTSICRKFHRILQAEIAFFDKQSQLICDSQNILSRSEVFPDVKQSLSAPYGVYSSFSDWHKADVMNVSVLFEDGIIRVSLPATDMTQTREFIVRSVMLSSALSIGIAILLGWILSRRIGRVVGEITQVATRISQGDLSQRVSNVLVEEMKPLAMVINSMAQNLDRQHRELTQEKNRLKTILEEMREAVIVLDQDKNMLLANTAAFHLFGLSEVCVGQHLDHNLRFVALNDLIDLTIETGVAHEKVLIWNRHDQEYHLAVQSSRLTLENTAFGIVVIIYDLSEVYRLENFRRDFVANVSHELKTPLTSILGYAETLATGDTLLDRDISKKFLEKIIRNSEQLKRLVNDLLKLSQLESGRLEVLCQPTDLIKTLQPLIKDFKIKAKASGHLLVNELPDSLPFVDAEETALIQVFSNLIDNALKYTSPEGSVTLSAEVLDQQLKVSVTDTGVGIPQEDLARVFERFYRVDKARSREAGGTGLGLSIVKHLLAQLDAGIEIKSEPAKGSVFTVVLRRSNS